MAITSIDRKGSKVGNLFTSNSNGTYFSLSKKHVSESDWGNVDFEKMQGVEGVALLNEVTNPNDVNQGKKKILRSLITVDNGRYFFFDACQVQCVDVIINTYCVDLY
jgi:hypothetical protein